MKLFLQTVLVLVLGAFIGGCRQQESARTPEKNGDLRIVSLAPSLTEILFELEVGSQIVGVTSYCDFPPEAREKTKVGDFINPSLEKIVQLDPGLVVAEHWPSSKTVPRLRSFGLSVLELPSPRSIEDIYTVIQELGAAVGREERSREIVHEMQKRIEIIQSRGEKMPYRPSIYLEIDLPSWTIGKQSFITEALELCGLQSVFADINRPALQASKEVIIARNPDLILSFTVTKEQISGRPGWDSIAAVRNGWIIDDFDEDLLSHANQRLVQGMEELQLRVLRLLQSRDREGAAGNSSILHPSLTRLPQKPAKRAQKIARGANPWAAVGPEKSPERAAVAAFLPPLQGWLERHSLARGLHPWLLAGAPSGLSRQSRTVAALFRQRWSGTDGR